MAKRPGLAAFKVGGQNEPDRAGEAATAPRTATSARSEVPASERKVATLRLSRDAWRQLKTLSMDLETSEQKLLALGCNMMFRAAGLPEIADEPYPEDELKAQGRRRR